jgi:glycosyltransferase involved in cell wall biosynthesis
MNFAEPNISSAPTPDETYILLATYNGEAFLPAQLDSLLGQEDATWRLLWRDDGSTDATVAQMAAFSQRAGPGRVRRLEEPSGRLGVLRTFMALLAAAPMDATYVAFCDQDDVWLPGKLARARKVLAKLPSTRPALYCARQQLVDAALQPIGLSPLPSRPPSFGNALAQNIATGCTVVMNAAARRAVLAAPPPPVGTVHDWWCYLIVSGVGGEVIFDPEPQILYRQHGRNVIGAPASTLIRVRAALRRGPGDFLRKKAAHLDALAECPMLDPPAREALEMLRGLRQVGPLRRLALLRRADVHRQGRLEDILLRFWVALLPLPTTD